MSDRLKLLFSWLLFTCCYSNISYSQVIDYNHYSPMKCEGETPSEFLLSSFNKYNTDAAGLSRSEAGSKKELKLQKEFTLINHYKIDEILFSGKVIYGNSVCEYINKVANKLLAKEPELKSKMRFYLLNVPYANAFATNNGIVMVTTGLMAQLENEAQLAFVLSHEISHYKLKHSYESYKKSQDIMTSKRYDDLGTDEKLIKLLKYSKEHEAEADVEGLKMFAKAGYDKNESIKMMDILLYSYLPFDEIPFPKDFFNDSFYKLPAQYFPDSATPISAAEDEDDEENSHPNIEFRKDNLNKYIKGTEKGTLQYFGSEFFDEVVKRCRYELGYLLVARGSYTKSFYHAYLLAQHYGENQYTSELMIGSMYGLHKWKINSSDLMEETELKTEEQGYEGEISIPFHLFMVMKKDEFNVLTARMIARWNEKYPTKYTNNIKCDAFIDLLYAHKFHINEFNVTEGIADEENLNSEDTLIAKKISTKKKDAKNISNTIKDSKVKKIKRNKRLGEISSNSHYFKNGFVTAYKSLDFTSFFDSIERVVAKIKAAESDLGLSQLRSEPYRRSREALRDDMKIQRNKGKALGIDSIIFISPSYSSAYYDAFESEVRFEKVEDEFKSIKISKFVEDYAQMIDLKTDLIDINQRGNLNTDQLNRYALVSNWITEKYSHVDRHDFVFSQKYMDSLVINDGYRNVCLSGFSYKSVKHETNAGMIVAGLFLLPAAPLIIGYAVDSDKELLYFSVVMDLTTGEQKLINYKTIRRRPKSNIIHMHLAYTMYQIKRKLKKK